MVKIRIELVKYIRFTLKMQIQETGKILYLSPVNKRMNYLCSGFSGAGIGAGASAAFSGAGVAS